MLWKWENSLPLLLLYYLWYQRSSQSNLSMNSCPLFHKFYTVSRYSCTVLLHRACMHKRQYVYIQYHIISHHTILMPCIHYTTLHCTHCQCRYRCCHHKHCHVTSHLRYHCQHTYHHQYSYHSHCHTFPYIPLHYSTYQPTIHTYIIFHTSTYIITYYTT
jgi:hypothetical protein